MSNEIDRFRRKANSFRADTIGFGNLRAGPTRCSGKFFLDGMGEAQVPIQFPVKFEAPPSLSCSFEIKEGDMLTTAKLPTLSASVIKWTIEDRPPYSSLYVGATLGIVTTGPPGQRLIVEWHVDGNAFMNPM